MQKKSRTALPFRIALLALLALAIVGPALATEYPSQVYGPFFVGTKIFNGVGAPDPGIGLNGDYYIDTASGQLYTKDSGGTWQVLMTLVGPQGAAGKAGSAWWSGITTPSNGIGSDNDYYLNTANGDLYNKTAGSWQQVMNTVGPQGPQGPVGLQGPVGEIGRAHV